MACAVGMRIGRCHSDSFPCYYRGFDPVNIRYHAPFVWQARGQEVTVTCPHLPPPASVASCQDGSVAEDMLCGATQFSW
jgi:hypothetical protein